MTVRPRIDRIREDRAAFEAFTDGKKLRQIAVQFDISKSLAQRRVDRHKELLRALDLPVPVRMKTRRGLDLHV